MNAKQEVPRGGKEIKDAAAEWLKGKNLNVTQHKPMLQRESRRVVSRVLDEAGAKLDAAP